MKGSVVVTSVCAKPKVMPYEPAEERKQFFRQSGATVLVEVRPRAGQGRAHSAFLPGHAVVGLLGPCDPGGTGTFCRLHLRV